MCIIVHIDVYCHEVEGIPLYLLDNPLVRICLANKISGINKTETVQYGNCVKELVTCIIKYGIDNCHVEIVSRGEFF